MHRQRDRERTTDRDREPQPPQRVSAQPRSEISRLPRGGRCLPRGRHVAHRARPPGRRTADEARPRDIRGLDRPVDGRGRGSRLARYSVGGKPGVFEAAAVDASGFVSRAAARRHARVFRRLAGECGYQDGSGTDRGVPPAGPRRRYGDATAGALGARQPRGLNRQRDADCGRGHGLRGGNRPTPPRGASAAGFEWLWRLAVEPGRMCAAI